MRYLVISLFASFLIVGGIGTSSAAGVDLHKCPPLTKKGKGGILKDGTTCIYPVEACSTEKGSGCRIPPGPHPQCECPQGVGSGKGIGGGMGGRSPSQSQGAIR